MKQKILVICPIISKGYSTGLAPIHVKIMNVDEYIQKIPFFWMLNFSDNRSFFLKGSNIIIMMDINKAKTPPNLLGIERKIA